MKKFITIAALLAAGTALASAVTTQTTTYSPLSSEEGWTTVLHATGGQAAQPLTFNDGTLTSTNLNWKQASAIYDFSAPLVLDSAEESLSFSFTLTSTGTARNSVGTVALRGVNGSSSALTVVAGVSYSGTNGANTTNFISGTSDNNTANSYLVNASANWSGGTVNITSGLTTLGAVTTAPTVFSGNIMWVTDQFVMTLVQGDSTATYNLGETYALNGLSIALDGGPSGGYPAISNLTLTHVSVVPEPSAFGLLAGVGALALVAARRRRSRK